MVALSVSIYLRYDDPARVIRSFEEALDDLKIGGKPVTLWTNPAITDPIERYVKALLTENAYLRDGVWMDDFEAGYMEEVILWNVFTQVLKCCDVGSFIEVSLDEDFWIMVNTEPGSTHEYQA